MGENGISRRMLLCAAAGATGALSVEAQAAQGASKQRAEQAYQIRQEVALQQKDAPAVKQTTNGDETAFPSRIGNYSKGLPHSALGEVETGAYTQFMQAMQAGAPMPMVEQIPMGSPTPALQMKFVNPCSGACFALKGADSHHLALPPAPSVQSAQAAGEAVELYWMALARDVNFTDFASNSITQAAAVELSGLSSFRGPTAGGSVTPQTLFRGFTTGDVKGPFVSQFLLKSIPFGAQYIEQKIRTGMAGIDYLTRVSDWLSVQNGIQPSQTISYDPVRRYVRNGRDLAMWVHMDELYQAYFNAMLTIVTPPDATDTVTGGGIGAPLNPGNPYLKSANQTGFGTFGLPAIATAVAEVAADALKAVWYQKWMVHRRLRPEAFGGLVNNILSGARNYPLHNDVLNSHAVANVKTQTGTYLLPQAFPEGSPMHPSYGAGHATIAGASITLLKALFDETFVVPNPVVASSDGLSLVPYTGPDAGNLTVGNELNKLAANVAFGRNFAGIHYRSDYENSLKLGEAYAISMLQDQKPTYGEPFAGFTFTKFDGTRVTV